MLPNKGQKKRITIFCILTLLIILSVSFQTGSVSGKTESKSDYLPGLTHDPFDLYESLPKKLSSPNINLPIEVNLTEKFPPPGDQGSTKNSVGFAVGFGLTSYYEAKKKSIESLHKMSPNLPEGRKNLYSANYIYSQLNGGKDQGASLLEALILAESRGGVSLELMDESFGNFRSKPKPSLIEQGRKARFSRVYRIESFDTKAIKQSLLEGHPVAIGYLVHSNFLNPPSTQIYTKPEGEILGAQSLIILGYNDKKRAFRVWNSWGKDWGDSGYLWISYDSFHNLVRSIYTIEPMTESELTTESKLVASLSKISYPGESLLPPKEVFVTRGDFSDRIRVSWSKQKHAIGYEIYRKRKSESKFQLVGLSKVSFFEDFGIQKAVAYTYRVASLNEISISEPSSDSNDGYAEEPAKSGGVLPITNLTASVAATNDRIILNWDPQSPGTKFAIYKWNPLTKIYRFLGRPDKPTYTDFKAARNGDSEIYQVIPERNSIIGEKSSYVSAHLDPMEILKPRPANLIASKGLYTGQVLLKWEGSPSAIQYFIYRKLGANWNLIGKTRDTEFTDSELGSSEDEKYYSIVAEFEGQLYSLPSEVDSGFPSLVAKRTGAPAAPNQVEILELPSQSEFQLTWTAVPKVKEYKVFFRKKSEKEWILYRTVTSNSVKVSKLPKNQFYFFTIQSVVPGTGESKFTDPTIGVLSDTIPDVKKIKTFGESNIQKFVGPWTAMYWDGKNKVKPIRLIIDADETGSHVVLKWNETEIYRGQNIIDSDLIEEKGKWRIQLSPTNESLSGEFIDRELVPEKSQLSFVRE
ncbi:MAG: cysteine protease [Leptospira sp.]|nr:cysteine protease [Leptospira sp.]